MNTPKRTESQEMTAVIPREHLPPISSTMLAALDLDPDHPETQELMSRVEDADPKDRPTLIPCPEGCRPCPCCYGGAVTVDRAAEWSAQKADEGAERAPTGAA